MNLNPSQKQKFLLTAGSTGGHIFPVICLAHELKQKGHLVHVISSGSSMEKKNFSSSKIPFSTLKVGRLKKGAPILERILTILCLKYYLLKSLFFILKFWPDKVVGFGGAVSGPILMAACLFRRKTALFELNAVSGLANKILSRFVDQIFVCFESTKKYFKKDQIFLTSFPVRKNIWITGSKKREPDGYFHILILGGSQGSHKINQVALDMYQSAMIDTFKIYHQTGRQDEESIKKICLSYPNIKCQAFFDDMGWCYQWADLVISRAGASTLAELAACQKASILIPLPSSDHHQMENALSFSKASAAHILVEEKLTAEGLYEAIMEVQNKKKTKFEKNISQFYDEANFHQTIQNLLLKN